MSPAETSGRTTATAVTEKVGECSLPEILDARFIRTDDDLTSLLEIIVDNPTNLVVSLLRIEVEASRHPFTSCATLGLPVFQEVELEWSTATEAGGAAAWTQLDNNRVKVSARLIEGACSGGSDQLALGIPTQVDIEPHSRRRITLKLLTDHANIQKLLSAKSVGKLPRLAAFINPSSTVRVRLQTAHSSQMDWSRVAKD